MIYTPAFHRMLLTNTTIYRAGIFCATRLWNCLSLGIKSLHESCSECESRRLACCEADNRFLTLVLIHSLKAVKLLSLYVTQFTKLSMYAHSFYWISVFYWERWISLPSNSLVSWAMPKILPWIAGRANKQFCTQAIEKKSTGAWTNNHNLLMQWYTKLKLGSFYLPGISLPTKI